MNPIIINNIGIKVLKLIMGKYLSYIGNKKINIEISIRSSTIDKI